LSKLAGKVAVVTGGSSGIGLATAKRFVAEGAYVFITGRRQSELDKAKAEIGTNVTAVQGDVQNLIDLDKLYAQVRAEKGVVDIVFANAGFIVRIPEHRGHGFHGMVGMISTRWWARIPREGGRPRWG
jgi:NAD(P)-dependent dehydrogenase (short-subunit alcohol dehydrogenase family)